MHVTMVRGRWYENILIRKLNGRNFFYTKISRITVCLSFKRLSIISCWHTCIFNIINHNIYLKSLYQLTFIAPYSPSNNVSLDGVSNGKLTFGWTFSVPDCTAINYNISSDCGSCLRTTDATNATCSDLPLSSNPLNCTFSVYPVVCGVAGEASNPITVTLKGIIELLYL